MDASFQHDTEPTGTPRAGQRRMRRAFQVLLVGTGLLLAAAAWLFTTSLLARSELLGAQHDLERLRMSSDLVSAEHTSRGGAPPHLDPAVELRTAAMRTNRAHRLTTGPLWYAASRLPVVGAPLRTVRGTADTANRLAHDVLPPLLHAAAQLTAGTGQGNGHLNLAALRDSAPALDRAARTAAHVRAETDALPRSTWLPEADRARAQLADRLDQIVSATAEAATAARLLPPVLGADGERRYFMVFQNTAESRGTGGLPGAFAVLTANHGQVGFEDFGNDTAMAHTEAAVDLGADYAAMYGHNGPTRTWVNSNLSPHFPNAARIWAAAWHQHSGQNVDGVIAIDPSALAPLLTATGPTRLPDGTVLTGANVVDLTERTSYATYQDTSQRKAFFLTVARAAAAQVLGAGHGSPQLSALMPALRTAMSGGHVLVWSAHPGEQRELESRAVSGVVPEGPAPFAGLVVNNAAGTKLDYYLERDLDWTAAPSTPAGREVTVTVALTNRAPTAALPAYVTQLVDAPDYPTRPGDNRLLVSYFATSGASLVGATLDGRTVLLQPGLERGHPTYTLDLELPARSTRTLVLRLLEPPSDRSPTLLRQPLAGPLRATVRTLARAETVNRRAAGPAGVNPGRP